MKKFIKIVALINISLGIVNLVFALLEKNIAAAIGWASAMLAWAFAVIDVSDYDTPSDK